MEKSEPITTRNWKKVAQLQDAQVECIHIGEDCAKQIGIVAVQQVLKRDVDAVGRPDHVKYFILRGPTKLKSQTWRSYFEKNSRRAP